LISSLTGLRETSELFSEKGFSTEIVLQRPVEDEILYVLRVRNEKSGK
jgi:hypothetical protein